MNKVNRLKLTAQEICFDAEQPVLLAVLAIPLTTSFLCYLSDTTVLE